MAECYQRIACFGGVYNNYLALAAAIDDARDCRAERLFCLGDMGAFGPHPDRIFPLLHEHGVQCIQGNYDDSIGNGLDDCQCGYTDPRDNHFAQISYDYTLQNTAAGNREFLRNLPQQRIIQLGPHQVLLCHGSPRRVNEFLWESTTPDHFLEYLCRQEQVDLILATHTGIKWHRPLPQGRAFVNVGVLGRPENDGNTHVWYTLLEHRDGGNGRGEIRVEFRPVVYDYHRLGQEMTAEKLPEEFVRTVETGWWTTCLEILPGKERRRGRH